MHAVHTSQKGCQSPQYGHEPTGIYEVLSNPHEVVMVWATDIPSQMTWRANRDAAHGLGDEGESDERIVAWERRSGEFTVGGATHVMTPLEQWLAT